MKYIRTKDGRIWENFCGIDEVVVPKEKTLKKSNTVEELCDELVFEWQRSSISHDNDVWHLYHEISLKEEVENALTDGYRESKEEVKNIYGAIWTEWGLKYVAKMNDKGELCLL